jgi:hypothetical protein
MPTMSTESLKGDTGVEVTGIEAKRWIWRGKEVPVRVSLCNRGKYLETVDVTLEDTTKDVIIGKQKVTVPPESSSEVTFEWNTKPFGLGSHDLFARVTPGTRQSQPRESFSEVTSERSCVKETIIGGCPIVLRGGVEEGCPALAEITRLTMLAARELETAKVARDEADGYRKEAENEAERAFEEVYEGLHSSAMRELEQAEAENRKAQQELAIAKSARAEAEEYKKQADAETRQRAGEI